MTADEKRKLEKVQETCKSSLKYLCKDVLRMEDWGSLHTDLEKYLKGSGPKKMILIPRGHLKSSVITIGYSIQKVLRDFNTRGLIANAVWDNARHFLYKISEYLTDKSYLPMLFGNFKSGRWNADEIVINQRTEAHAEATIATTGVEKTQTSQHYDWIVMDDLVVRENINTQEQRNKVIDFYRDTLDLLEPGGELVIIGTRWAMGDLYQHLIENEMRSLNGKDLENEEQRKVWRELIAA